MDYKLACQGWNWPLEPRCPGKNQISNLDLCSLVDKPTIPNGYGPCHLRICSGRSLSSSSEAEGTHAETHTFLWAVHHLSRFLIRLALTWQDSCAVTATRMHSRRYRGGITKDCNGKPISPISEALQRDEKAFYILGSSVFTRSRA